MDVREINAKAEAFERMAAAVERAVDALEKLGEIKHGGIKIEMVGSVMECTVKPDVGLRSLTDDDQHNWAILGDVLRRLLEQDKLRHGI